ncbi:MAG: hypothetical protein ACE5I1_14370 [bacterium]
MCNCVEKITQKELNWYQQNIIKNDPNHTVKSAKLRNAVNDDGEAGKIRDYDQFAKTYSILVIRCKEHNYQHKLIIYHNFCPFCGQPYSPYYYEDLNDE